MKKIALLSLILATVSPAFSENLPPLPPPNEDLYRQVLQQIDEYCHSQPPAEESRLYCFLEQVHLRKEQGELEPGLFERLLREGHMRLAWRKGFQEGLNQCRPGPLPPKPPIPKEPKPEPSASPAPQPSPKPTGTPKPKGESPKNEKVVICHKPSGDESKARTLRVSSSAVSAHLAHGDSLGECSDSSSKDGSNGSGQGNSKDNKGKGQEKEKSKK